MNKKDIIFARLQKEFLPSFLEVIDESAQHHGHSGYQADGSHYAIKITAASFKNKSRVNIHREIYQILTDLIPDQIHALRIEII